VGGDKRPDCIGGDVLADRIHISQYRYRPAHDDAADGSNKGSTGGNNFVASPNSKDI